MKRKEYIKMEKEGKKRDSRLRLLRAVITVQDKG